jgi:pimeloyl-ACP methyl ester carboxylesterase
MLGRVKDRLLGGAAVMVDRAATLAVEARSRSGKGPRIAVSHASRVAFLERVAREYPNEAALSEFVDPTPIAPLVRRVRSERGLGVFDAVWPSGYAPRLSSFAERYSSGERNHFAVARLFRRSPPRPLIIVVHGYMSGSFPIEERLWPIDAFDAMGYDTALFVLPFHGLRSTPARGLVPEFPGSDPRMTIEGFFQAIRDLRGLVRWLRLEGHHTLGLMGMSLGAYTAALAATVEQELAFLVPVVPLASLADFAREQGSLSRIPAEAELEYSLLERLYRPVSPLALAPLVPPERVLVVGARADRVTPIEHARRMADHFRAPLLAFRGGHLLQFGRRAAFEQVFALLERARG